MSRAEGSPVVAGDSAGIGPGNRTRSTPLRTLERPDVSRSIL